MTRSAEYLVSHGATAALTRCGDPLALIPRRGDRVVFRSPRGLELGEILGTTSTDSVAVTRAVSPGELLRHANADDEQQAESWRRCGLALLDDIQIRIAEQQLPLLALDAEILLDGNRAFVHVLRWDVCPLTPLIESLHAAHGIPISFQDGGKPEVAHDDHHDGCGSCGDGGCGTGGCSTGGCGSGSCSSGSVKSADDLTMYFAALRQQMLHAQERVPLA